MTNPITAQEIEEIKARSGLGGVSDGDCIFALNKVPRLVQFVEELVAVVEEQQMRLDSLFTLYVAKTYSRNPQSDLDLILASGKTLLAVYHANPKEQT